MASAQQLLDKVGSKVAWSEVKTVATFRAKLAKAELTLPHLGGGIQGWILRTVTPVVTTIVVIAAVYYSLKAMIPCCKLHYHRRKEEAAMKMLNQPREPDSADEPMEIDEPKQTNRLERDFDLPEGPCNNLRKIY